MTATSSDAGHKIWLGWAEKGVQMCAKCGKPIEPTGVTKQNVAKGWRHRVAGEAE